MPFGAMITRGGVESQVALVLNVNYVFGCLRLMLLVRFSVPQRSQAIANQRTFWNNIRRPAARGDVLIPQYTNTLSLAIITSVWLSMW